MERLIVVTMVMILSVLTVESALGDGYVANEQEWTHMVEEEDRWCMDQGLQDYADKRVSEDRLMQACGLVTNADAIFYDATPETITDQVYIDRIEELLGTKVYSIELHDADILGGYRLYRLIIKWESLTTFNGEDLYGLDCFVRFCN